MFERFTSEVRDVLADAQEHVHRLRHGWIGCEHLLLGVAGSATSVGSLLREKGADPAVLERAIVELIGPGPGDDDRALLATLGIDLEVVRHTVEATFGPGVLDGGISARRVGTRRRRGLRRSSCTMSIGKPAFTPRAQRCLEQSLREALHLRHNHIGVEHLALALLVHDDTAAWSVLSHVGIVPAQLRRTIEESQRRTA